VFIASVFLYFFQEASGIDAIVLYSPRIFEKAGITNSDIKLLCMVNVGFTKTVFVLTATILLDRIGRRPLLLTSLRGIIVSLTILGVALTIIDQTVQKVMWAVALSIAMVLLFVAFFSIGMGPVTWVYTSEVFPLKLCAQGVSIGVAVQRVTSGVISMTFISLYKAITIGGAFLLFVGIALATLVFVYFCLPETQG
jgi:MFS family permease